MFLSQPSSSMLRCTKSYAALALAMYVELSPLNTAKRKVTEAIRAVEEVSANELASLMTFRRAPAEVWGEISAIDS